MKTARHLLHSFVSGVLIILGCAIFLSCENRVIGATLFTVALCTICNFGMPLYTGMVSYVDRLGQLPELALCFIGNAAGCIAAGMALGYAQPSLAQKAMGIVENKLALAPLRVVVLAIFCGMLMFIAVQGYRSLTGTARYISMFLCIPSFILSGFEHSVADVGYFAIAGVPLSVSAVVFILLAVVGNAMGGQLLYRASRKPK